MAGQNGEPDTLGPETAYAVLRDDPQAVLVDVRTLAERTFVGVPDLSRTGARVWQVEWASYPEMTPDPQFADRLSEKAAKTPSRLLFICRSGVRSMAAARAAAARFAGAGLSIRCTNVAEGFEGDRDENGHRGVANGWKARGLPWIQT